MELECENDLVNRAFSTPLLTNCGSKGYSKDRNGVTTPQNTRTAILDFSPNIFNKVMPIEIN